jgi:exopolysaccharide biosynthesis polyprenyl glycosylphosphotransferase
VTLHIPKHSEQPPKRSNGSAPTNDGAPTNGKRHLPSLSQSEQRRAGRHLRVARIGDFIVAVAALLGGFLAANPGQTPAGLQQFLEMRLTVKNFLLVIAFAAACRLIGALVGLYDRRLIGNRRAETVRVLAAVTAGSAVATIFPIISVTRAFSPLAIVYYWIASVAGMLLLRGGLRTFLTRTAKVQDVLIVGSGPRAFRLYNDLRERHPGEFRLLGFVDSSDGEVAPDIQSKLLGTLDRLESILMRQAVDEVFIALPARSRYAEIQQAIEVCERGGVPAKYLGDVFQSRQSDEVHGTSASLTAVPAGIAPDDPRLLVKRGLDILLGSIALIVVFPILLLAAIAIKLTSRGPVIFEQERYGRNKRLFKMYKLRTMVVDAEAQQGSLETHNEVAGPVFKIRQDPRVTRLGRVLRRLSIDELPQLVNVIRGDMSLVGPRPLPHRDVSRFSEPALMRRFSVYPGITGLWQVSGRSELDFDDWIRLDLQYIDEWSLALEAQILLRTVPTVLRGTGAV